MNGDWEDMAILKEKTQSWIYLADIGNNPLENVIHQIHVIKEPNLKNTQFKDLSPLKFRTIKFQYENNTICNSECLLVDPLTKKIYIISKIVQGQETENTVWELPFVEDYTQTYTAKLVLDSIKTLGDNKQKVTGGDISPDGKSLVLRTYKDTAYLWKLTSTKTIAQSLQENPLTITIAKERGGEAICFSNDGTKLFSVYDGRKKGKEKPLFIHLIHSTPK